MSAYLDNIPDGRSGSSEGESNEAVQVGEAAEAVVPTDIALNSILASSPEALLMAVLVEVYSRACAPDVI